MKTGIFIALLLHVAFLLFGGLLFPGNHEEKKKIVMISLEDAPQDKPPEQPKPQEETDIKPTEDEPPPNADLVLKDLERPADAPALQSFDLDQLTAVLNGIAGAEGFGGGDMGLASGGRIGGTGKAIGDGIGDGAEDTFGTADIDQKPRAVFQAQPTFPSEMRGKKIEGAVVVVFIVTPEGRVTNQRAESSNNAAFEKPALDAVKQWKFEPGLRGGQKVSTRMRVTIRFARS